MVISVSGTPNELLPVIRRRGYNDIYRAANIVRNAGSLFPPLFRAFSLTNACMAVAFQLGVDSASPTITYDPFFPNVTAQDATSGWTPYYTNSGFPSSPCLVGNGTRLQISSKNGSFFSITWFGAFSISILAPRSSKLPRVCGLRSIDSPRTGTGIDLYGNATQAAFEVMLNSKNGARGSGDVLVGPGSNLLASFSNLALDTYTVTLTANTSSSPSSFIAFEKAIITSAVSVANQDR